MLASQLGGVSMGGDNDGIVHVNSAYHDKACPAREGGPNTKSEEIKGLQFRKCMRTPDQSVTNISEYSNIFVTNIYSDFRSYHSSSRCKN